VRRAVCVGGILLAGSSLAACKDSSGPPGFSQTVKGEEGIESSVRFGADAVMPDDFPSGVPLPDAGPLRSVVSEKNPPNASYTMTYGLGGDNGNSVGDAYRRKLENAGYKIEHFSSVGGSDSQITQFDAIGKRWDVAVVSGRLDPRDRAMVSVQVITHGYVSSGIVPTG